MTTANTRSRSSSCARWQHKANQRPRPPTILPCRTGGAYFKTNPNNKRHGKRRKDLGGTGHTRTNRGLERQYGNVFIATVGDSVCYLKKPSRKALGYASFASKNNPLNFNEVILNDCWLGGDESIRTDDSKFLGISGAIAQLIEVKEAEIKKL